MEVEVENFLRRSLCTQRSRFTDSQVVAVLKQVELDASLHLAQSGLEPIAGDGGSSHIDPGTALTHYPWTTPKVR